MSKIENVFKMLLIIKENELVTSVELAKILNVTERQIQTYARDMKKAGINIKSKRGHTGGYYIEECPFCNKNIINLKDDN